MPHQTKTLRQIVFSCLRCFPVELPIPMELFRMVIDPDDDPTNPLPPLIATILTEGVRRGYLIDQGTVLRTTARLVATRRRSPTDAERTVVLQGIWLWARARRDDPTADPALRTLVEYHLAAVCANVGERSDALGVLLWLLRGQYYEQDDDLTAAADCYAQAVILGRAGVPMDSALALALDHLAAIRDLQGDTTAAIALFQEGLAIARATNDPSFEIHVRCRLGHLFADTGAMEEAIQCGEAALHHATNLAEPQAQYCIDALNLLGTARYRHGDAAGAIRIFRQAITLSREAYGEQPQTGILLGNLGITLCDMGDAAGKDYLEQALVIHEHHSDLHVGTLVV